MLKVAEILIELVAEALRWLRLAFRSSQSIRPENLFLRLLYVFVVIEHHSRRLIHCNVTAHPSATWTLQQLREAVGFEEQYEYLLHDRDGIFANQLDESIERLGVKVSRSPPRSPKAYAVCERVIGTIRCECLEWLIPVFEHHLRHILKSWIRQYYCGLQPLAGLGFGECFSHALAKSLDEPLLFKGRTSPIPISIVTLRVGSSRERREHIDVDRRGSPNRQQEKCLSASHLERWVSIRV
jgi:uncharacterized protein with PIN domain